MPIPGLRERAPRWFPQAPPGARERYLTDGTRLFRRTTDFERCPAGFVWLEDCRSLAVVLATVDEVAHLVPVRATGEETDPR